MGIDVLEPLKPWEGHYLYLRARFEVLQRKRSHGPQAARRHASDIADAMLEQKLSRA